MEWTDDGVVMGVRRHGETSVILEAMTRDHGRHLGLVRGGRSKTLQPILQPGNVVRLVWRARVEEHLGHYVVEGLTLHAARFIASRQALYGIGHVTVLLRLLAERDPHPHIYGGIEELLGFIDRAEAAPEMIARFEFAMLEELGFGLDLSQCAATGSRDGLVYVSPKSGRAVSREAGAPWKDRLLALPAFLLGGEEPPSPHDVADAFALTGYFLERDVFGPRGIAMPDGRRALLAALDAVRA